MVLTLACSRMPDSIPDEPGTIAPDTVPDLVTVSSPDAPWLVWLTALQLGQEDYRDCPRVSYLRGGAQIYADAGEECTDSAGVRWTGHVSYLRRSDQDFAIDAARFGATEITGAWQVDGSVVGQWTNSYLGLSLTTEMALTTATPDVFEMWIDTEGDYGFEDGAAFADTYSGTVGLQGWGTAEVDGRRIYTAVTAATSCSYGHHPTGILNWKGRNDAQVDFRTGDEIIRLADTADTGGGDTGVDDCGSCGEAEIDEVLVDECVEIERPVAWPFTRVL
jgi:hypothetical protein